MKKVIAVVVLLIALNSTAGIVAQQLDSLTIAPTKDSTYFKRVILTDSVPKKKWSSPKKAMVLALICPGAGQVYNKKYWKLPILYVGAGVLAYFWVTNQQLYKEFETQYTTQYANVQANPTYTFVYFSEATQSYYTSVGQLSSERDTYRRYRDFSIAGSVALYAVSILDAYVDAHLKDFDLSPDLSFSVKPLFYKNNATFVTGLSLNFKLKNNKIQQSQFVKRHF